MAEVKEDELQGAVGDAIRALRQVASDNGQTADSRVAAATAILDFATGLAGTCPPEEHEQWMEEDWEEEEGAE